MAFCCTDAAKYSPRLPLLFNAQPEKILSVLQNATRTAWYPCRVSCSTIKSGHSVISLQVAVPLLIILKQNNNNIETVHVHVLYRMQVCKIQEYMCNISHEPLQIKPPSVNSKLQPVTLNPYRSLTLISFKRKISNIPNNTVSYLYLMLKSIQDLLCHTTNAID